MRVESSTGVSVSYAYDAQNHRVKREGKDGTTVYAYGRNGALTYQKNLTSGLERSFTYLGSTLFGWTETVGGESHKFFAVTDALGSVTQIRDEENNVVWDGEYAPFGILTAVVGKKRFGGMFTGKDIDPETGLTYHWHRWRSEDGTSFISEDPARDGINWYGYVAANPLRWIDPTGLAPHGMTREDADKRGWHYDAGEGEGLTVTGTRLNDWIDPSERGHGMPDDVVKILKNRSETNIEYLIRNGATLLSFVSVHFFL